MEPHLNIIHQVYLVLIAESVCLRARGDSFYVHCVYLKFVKSEVKTNLLIGKTLNSLIHLSIMPPSNKFVPALGTFQKLHFMFIILDFLKFLYQNFSKLPIFIYVE